MSVKVLLPQPILPEGYAYLKDHGFEVVDGRGFTEDDIIADIADCDAMIVQQCLFFLIDGIAERFKPARSVC